MKKLKTTLPFLFFLSISAVAQETHVFHSKYMPGPDTVRFFRPDSYHSGKKYSLLYLLHGYPENYLQWGTFIDLKAVAEKYDLIIVCPNGYRTWYLNSPVQKNSRFEDFFFQELAPYIQQHYTIDRRHIFISGLSMGGYGALHLFLAHSGYFSAAASTSGTVRFDYAVMKTASMRFFGDDRVLKDLSKILGPHGPGWDRFSIESVLKIQKPAKGFYFDCGTEDLLLPMNNELDLACKRLDIRAVYHTESGQHDPAYWQKAFQHHLDYFKLAQLSGPASGQTIIIPLSIVSLVHW